MKIEILGDLLNMCFFFHILYTKNKKKGDHDMKRKIKN